MDPCILIDQIIGDGQIKYIMSDTDRRLSLSWSWSESNNTVVLRGIPCGSGIPSSISSFASGYFSI